MCEKKYIKKYASWEHIGSSSKWVRANYSWRHDIEIGLLLKFLRRSRRSGKTPVLDVEPSGSSWYRALLVAAWTAAIGRTPPDPRSGTKYKKTRGCAPPLFAHTSITSAMVSAIWMKLQLIINNTMCDNLLKRNYSRTGTLIHSYVCDVSSEI